MCKTKGSVTRNEDNDEVTRDPIWIGGGSGDIDHEEGWDG